MRSVVQNTGTPLRSGPVIAERPVRHAAMLLAMARRTSSYMHLHIHLPGAPRWESASRWPTSQEADGTDETTSAIALKALPKEEQSTWSIEESGTWQASR